MLSEYSKTQRDETAHPEERDGSHVPAGREGSRVPAGMDGAGVPARRNGYHPSWIQFDIGSNEA